MSNISCLEQIINTDDSIILSEIDNNKLDNSVFICYDIDKIYKNLSDNDLLVYDIKILYQLKGYKFDNLEELINQVLPKEETKNYTNKLNSFRYNIKSFKLLNIDITKFKNSDLFFDEVINDYYEEKKNILIKLFEKFNDEGIKEYYKNYFYSFLNILCATNSESLIKNNIKINAIGAKTGRMSCKKGTLNIYNLNKSDRGILKAREDYSILQIDYRAFQPRLAIMSTSDEEFKNKFKQIRDIYSVFSGDREKNKISFLAWMFSDIINDQFDKEAFAIRKLRMELCEQLKQNNKIINLFGRILYFNDEPEHIIFQNYITSLEVDFIIGVYKKIYGWLNKKNYKTRIIFPFYDSIIFEIHKKELDIVKKLEYIMCNIYKDEIFNAEFPVESKMGNNFGELNEIR